MKKSMLLRAAALALIILTMAPCLLACDQLYLTDPAGDAPASPSQGDRKSGKPIDGTSCGGVPQVSFNGEQVKFYVMGHGLNSRSIDLGEDDDPELAVNMQVKKRNEQVEKELNVDIVLSRVQGMSEMGNSLGYYLASGTYFADVVGLYQYFDLGYALSEEWQGAFYNLNNMPEGQVNYLNLDAPYWDSTLYEELSYKGTAYYFTGDLNQSYVSTVFVSYVNADLWARYADKIAKLPHSGGFSDPYDIVKNGYWTLDLWIELADLLYTDNGNTEGKVDYKDQVGVMTYNEQLNNIMADMLVAGSHVNYGTRTADGTPQVAINTKENVAFYNKLYTLLCETKAATIPWLSNGGEEDDTYIMDVFAKGNVLLTVNTLHCAESYLDGMKDEYLVLPLPMFDHAQYDENSPSLGYSTQLGDSVNHYAIPKSIGDEKIPVVTATLEQMGYYSKLWVTPAYYADVLGEKYEKDARVSEMLELTRKGIYTDFIFLWSNELDNVTWKFRTNYDEQEDRREANLKSWHRTVQGKLKKLLPQIEYGFYDESA